METIIERTPCTQLSEEMRFNVLRSLPHVEVRYMHTKRVQDTDLSLNGVRLASQCRIFSHGKLESTYFCITDKGIELSNR